MTPITNVKPYKSAGDKERENIRDGIICVIFAIIIIIMAVIGLSRTFDDTVDTSEYTLEEYCVQPGDSLWSIAEEYCKEEDDIRDWIHAVEELNDCSANIRAHSWLIIYAK